MTTNDRNKARKLADKALASTGPEADAFAAKADQLAETNAGTALAVRQHRSEIAQRSTDPAVWLDTWLAGKTPNTASAYRSDLEHLAHAAGYLNTPDMVADLIFGDDDRAAATASFALAEWKGAMQAAEAAPSTINRRLSAGRAMFRHANEANVIEWTVSIKGVKAETYRDTSGPGEDAVLDMLDTCDPSTAKGARDAVIIGLMLDMGLRRAEVHALDASDYNSATGKLSVIRKGKTARKALTVPQASRERLTAWLAHRGTEPGPMFVSTRARDAGKFRRLTLRSIGNVVASAGERSNVGHVRPHGIRHTAITAALDAGADVRAVRDFAGHKDVNTTMIYDDNRRDLAGEVAERTAAARAARRAQLADA